MKIASAQVQAQSEHLLETASFSMERLNFWTGTPPQESVGIGDEEPAVKLELTSFDERQKLLAASSRTKRLESAPRDQEDQKDVKLRLLEAMVFALTGKRIRLCAVDEDLLGQVKGDLPTQSFQGRSALDWGLEYDSFHSYEENEQMNYAASGSVKTEDGRTINFRLELSLSRSYYEQSSVSIRMGSRPRTDPLVIAYAGSAPTLSRQKVAFDLDADGKTEQISFATAGSGFLALDKNGDGIINNGTELFGPQSGNGFTDLRAYDIDNNGWIDENDPVFGKLSILTMGEDGSKTLFSLGQAGVGAIYLQDTKTEYALTNTTGQRADGVMRASSVFLRENGTAGTIHHIDLTI